MKDIDKLLKGKIPSPETGIEVRKSICTICDPGPFCCGLDVSVKDEKIIKIEGNADHPYNMGTLCAKGAANRQYVYHGDRLHTPLKRVGERGSGKFTPVSWDEALDTIAEKLNAIKKEHGPESVAFFAGYPKYFRPYLKRLAHSFGSPNYLSESSTCYYANILSEMLVFGTPSRADTMNTACLLIWTHNQFYTTPPNSRSILKAKERGVKIIVVDPRKTPTTAIADIHLQLRPGTDGALALSMANVIIDEKLYDADFIANHTYGFDEYRRYVQLFPPDKGEEITGVPAGTIREAARLYALTKPASVMTSASAIVHHTNGVQNSRAFFCLIGLTGNYDIKGGNIMSPRSVLHMPNGMPTREEEFMQSRPWSEMSPRIGADAFPVWTEMVDEEAQAMHLPFQIRSGKPYPVKAVLGFGLNYRMWPDSDGMLRSLGKLDLFVNVDLFMTDTCKYADIVLPACSSLERSELRGYPVSYIIFSQPAIHPLYDSRSDADIIYDLALRLGLDDPLFKAGYEASIDWMLEPGGITMEELKKHPGGMPVPRPGKMPEKRYLRGGFTTPSGKMEFKSMVLEKYEGTPGLEALPVYHPPALSLQATPEIAVDYPFIFNTGSRLPMFIHSRAYRMSWTSSLRPDHPAADINPEDAAGLGIRQNDSIRLSTPEGSITVNANLTQMVQPGVVHFFHGHSQADVNLLFKGDYLDPVSGYPGFKSALCKIEKV